MTTWEHYAIAPAQSSLALVDGRLPSVETSWRLTDVLDAFEPLIGRPPYLRMAAHAEVDGDRAVRLHVFDLGETTARDAEVPGPLRPAFDRWLAEQRGAEPPALRAAWARPGWLAAAEAWAGCALRPHRMWPLSAVLRGSLAGETVFACGHQVGIRMRQMQFPGPAANRFQAEIPVVIKPIMRRFGVRLRRH